MIYPKPEDESTLRAPPAPAKTEPDGFAFGWLAVGLVVVGLAVLMVVSILDALGAR